MRVNEVGTIERKGAVQPIMSMVTSNCFAALVSYQDTSTITVLRFHRGRVKLVWDRQIKQRANHTWAGGKILLNVGTIIPANRDSIFVASGIERLLLNAETGTVLASGAAIASPTAPASLIRGEWVVAEGQALSGYDAHTLGTAWAKPIPGQMWAFAQPADGFLPIEEESGEAAFLWCYKTEMLWSLPGVAAVRSQPLLTNDSLVIVASGLGAPDQVNAVDRATGNIRWTVSFPRSELIPPPAPAPAPVFYPASVFDDLLIVITATPSIEAMTINDGKSVWRIALSSEPVVLVRNGDLAWIANVDGNVSYLDLERGKIIGAISLPGISKYPVAIIPLESLGLSGSALVITRLGKIFQVMLN